MDYPGLSGASKGLLSFPYGLTITVTLLAGLFVAMLSFLYYSNKDEGRWRERLSHTLKEIPFLTFFACIFLIAIAPAWVAFENTKQEIVTQDRDNWKRAVGLHGAFVDLERTLAIILGKPQANNIEVLNSELSLPQKTILLDCRVVSVDIVSPSSVSGTADGSGGGMFGGPIHLKQRATATPDL